RSERLSVLDKRGWQIECTPLLAVVGHPSWTRVSELKVQEWLGQTTQGVGRELTVPDPRTDEVYGELPPTHVVSLRQVAAGDAPVQSTPRIQRERVPHPWRRRSIAKRGEARDERQLARPWVREPGVLVGAEAAPTSRIPREHLAHLTRFLDECDRLRARQRDHLGVRSGHRSRIGYGVALHESFEVANVVEQLVRIDRVLNRRRGAQPDDRWRVQIGPVHLVRPDRGRIDERLRRLEIRKIDYEPRLDRPSRRDGQAPRTLEQGTSPPHVVASELAL